MTIDVRGVGYDVAVPLSTLLALPQDGEVFLYVHTALRENALELYGFIDHEEKALFEMLLGVTGIGSRLALVILSGMSPERFAQAVLGGDAEGFTCIPGIGKKLAERIVLELKDKIIKVGFGSVSTPRSSAAAAVEEELVSSLINLGYRDAIARETAKRAVQECTPGASLEQALKVSLKTLAP